MKINKEELNKIKDVLSICDTYGIKTIKELKDFYNIARRTNFDILLTKMKIFRKL